MILPYDARVTRWTIESGPATPFTLTTREMFHDLGIAGQPCFRLTQPLSPDDAWDVYPMPQSAPLRDLEAELPAGEYVEVRTYRTPQPGSMVLLGNELVDYGPGMVTLLHEDGFYVGIVGRDRMRRPDLSGPLLAVVVLNYDGSSLTQGVLLFSCFEPAVGSSDGLTLIIPATGPLVLDNLGAFGAALSKECKRTWCAEQLPRLAALLAREEESGE